MWRHLLSRPTAPGVLSSADDFSRSAEYCVLVIDWRVLVAAVGLAALVIVHAALEPGTREPQWIDFVLLGLASLVLVLRDRAPRVVLAVAALCVFVYLLRVEQDVIAVTPVLIAIYTVVQRGHRLLGVLASVPFLVVPFVHGYAFSDGLLSAGWFVAAFLMGEYHRQWEQRVAELERAQEEVARRRAGEERLHIARELHDSLTHTISVIKVQAGVAVHLARKRGEDVPESLIAIQESARDATRELRSTLGVLRADDVTPTGLDRLAELTARAADGGVTAEVTTAGSHRKLPAEVDRAAYRIIQEALTNVGRHSTARRASVSLEYGSEELVVHVSDDGPAHAADSSVPGVGLLGMRERVAALGGQLEAGPRPEGGFAVTATLPTDDRVS